MTHEEFAQEVARVNPRVELLGEFADLKSKVKWRCRGCGKEKESIARNILNGHSCLSCSAAESARKRCIESKRTFRDRLKKVNPNIIPLGEYVNNQTKIQCKCAACGHLWEAKPANLLIGRGCRVCGLKRLGDMKRNTHENFIERLNAVTDKVEVLGRYYELHGKIDCKCRVCGHVWTTSPCSLLQGSGCPECVKVFLSNKFRDTMESFKEKLCKVNPDVEVFGAYENAHTKVSCHCLLCGNVWHCTPNNLMNGNGCPFCHISKGETRVKVFLESKHIEYEMHKRFEDCRDTFELPFDFWIPEKKIAIEYDGIQHFQAIGFFGGEKTFEGQKRRDEIKTCYCKEHNYRLVRIRYDENVDDVLTSVFPDAGGSMENQP